MRGGPLDHSLWTRAGVLFDLREPGAATSRPIRLRRPHGLVGRVVGADVPIADTAVAARHAYLHVDERGVCVVDLATRTGTRVNGEPIQAAWLAVGDMVEIAGRELTLREIRLNDVPIDPDPSRDEILSDRDEDAAERPLVRLTLEPHRDHASWVVGSELVFLGRDGDSGLRIGGGPAANIDCALLRSNTCAYLIDLHMRDSRVNLAPVRGAARLADGDLVQIGRERFTVHIEPVSGEIGARPAAPPSARPRIAPARSSELAGIRPENRSPGDRPPPPASLDALPAETRESVLAWMMGAVQVSHGELLRRQDELRDALGQVLKQVHDESNAALEAQAERIDALNEELENMRQRIEAAPSAPTAPPLPVPPEERIGPPAPFAIARRVPPEEFVGPPAPLAERSRETAVWMIQRMDAMGRERRFSFRDLFRFGRRRETFDEVDDLDQPDEDSALETDSGDEGPTIAS